MIKRSHLPLLRLTLQFGHDYRNQFHRCVFVWMDCEAASNWAIVVEMPPNIGKKIEFSICPIDAMPEKLSLPHYPLHLDHFPLNSTPLNVENSSKAM